MQSLHLNLFEGKLNSQRLLTFCMQKKKTNPKFIFAWSSGATVKPLQELQSFIVIIYLNIENLGRRSDTRGRLCPHRMSAVITTRSCFPHTSPRCPPLRLLLLPSLLCRSPLIAVSISILRPIPGADSLPFTRRH